MTLVAVVAALGTAIAAQRANPQEVALQEAIRTETIDRDLRKAITQYEAVAGGADRTLASRALERMADVHRLLGDARAAAATRTRLAALASPAGQAPTGTTARLVWSGGGGGGALSPDGRFEAAQIGATGDLGIRELATNTRRNLTNTGGWVASGDYVEEALFSPDGSQVAYLWFMEGEGRCCELRMLPTAPGNSAQPRTLLRTRDYTAPVAWTPDGRRLIVKRQQQQDRTWQIGLLTLADGSYQGLKSVEWRSPSGFSLSPDGRLLVFDMESGIRGSTRDIYVLAIDGSRETTLVADAANDTSPLWSADGSHVLFLSNRGGTTALWRQPVSAGVAAGAPVLVKPDMDRATPLGISRSGALFYHVRGASRQNVHIADLDANGLARSARPVGNVVNANQGPVWSRDGRYLAYYSAYNPTLAARPATSNLVVRTVATGVERVVPLPSNVVNTPINPGPRWLPDNRSVLVLLTEPEGTSRNVYRFDTETAETELVWRITHRTGAFAFDVAPDGRSIYVAFQGIGDGPRVDGQETGALVRYDLETRQETFLRRNGWFIALAVSPDGTQLASLRTQREKKTAPSIIEVIPTAGGPVREVYRHPEWYDGSRYNTLTWSADQRHLIFSRPDVGDEGAASSWRVPAAGGPPEKLGLLDIKTPTVRPDGRQIAFALRENDDNEIWMLENYLPRPR